VTRKKATQRGRKGTPLKRLLTIMTVIALMGVLIAAPAGATPRNDDGEHRVVVCHQTGNGKFIAITIDVAGWENGHGGHDGDFTLPGWAGDYAGKSKAELKAMCVDDPTPPPG
jgi:hypothetical protein